MRMSPVRRQTLLFSATMTHEVSKLISLSLRNPVLLTVDSRRNVADRLVQEFIRIRSDRGRPGGGVAWWFCFPGDSRDAVPDGFPSR